MSAPRQFDEREVVERAMRMFWQRGYEGCSISDLVSATGVQRQSLYLAFGDKRGLFLAALQHYRELALASLGPLAEVDAGLAALEKYVRDVLLVQQSADCGACFMVKTAFGTDTRDEDIRRVVEQTSAAVRAAMAKVVERAMDRGELPRSTKPADTAAYLFSLLHGLSALLRTGGNTRQIGSVIAQAFTGLSQPEPGQRVVRRK